MNWLRNFMMGRYGLDQMTVGLLVGDGFLTPVLPDLVFAALFD